MKKAIDVNDLEAQFIKSNKAALITCGSVARKGPAFVIGGDENSENDKVNWESSDEDDNLVIEFNDKITIEPLKRMSNSNSSSGSGLEYVSYAKASSVNTEIDLKNGKNSKGQSRTNMISSYSSSPSYSMTVEELEAQLISGLVIGPNSPISQLVGAGPPPGLTSSNQANVGANANNSQYTSTPPGIANISSFSLGLYNTTNIASISNNKTNSNNSSHNNSMSSTAPLSKNDPNREFMNKFERNLIMKIHTTQLTTETPLMDDFYYQALTKKKATASEGSGNLLYFPLPSVADRQKELRRRERRRKQREREREKDKDSRDKDLRDKDSRDKDKDKENTLNSSTDGLESGISVELVLGKVCNSSSRKPRQQLQIPSNFTTETIGSESISLHDQVMKGIEAVYCAILEVEDFYLRQEEIERSNGLISIGDKSEELTELIFKANKVFYRELRLSDVSDCNKNADDNNLNNISIPTASTLNAPNHFFIHFLTIPKGRASLFRVLKLMDDQGKLRFLSILVEHFDFLEVVRPETSLEVIDSFIGQVLSPLVAFVGEAEWRPVLAGLQGLFDKRSFVWIALTKAGMVLLCILLSRLEILKAIVGTSVEYTGTNTTTGDSVMLDEAAALTEKMFEALEGHLLEFFTTPNVNVNTNANANANEHSSRDFYAWQCLALLAMNVESDQKRAMILELRDKILMVVESGDERAIKNLNVFLNALGLDASQLS